MDSIYNVPRTKTNYEQMGTIKDRDGMDLIEEEDIKKRWQEYAELYKKIFMTQINKIARRNINNLRYADDTTLWQKVKRS